MGFEEVLVTRLESQVTLVENRVYPVEAPQNPDMPYLTYEVLNDPEMQGMTQSHELSEPLVRIECCAETPTLARDIGRQVRTALMRWADATTSPVILDCMLREDADLRRDPEEPEPRLYRRAQEWEFMRRV